MSDHMFEIYVNNQPMVTEEHEMIGDSIKALAGIPLDYALYLLLGNESVRVNGDEVVHIREDMRFRAIPAATMGVRSCPRHG